VRWRSLLQHRGFRRLWIGDVVSMFGDWFTYVAVGMLALAEGDGLRAVAVVLIAHTLPRAILAPLAGWLADRHDRRVILVVGSLLRAATVVAMIAAAGVGALEWVQILLFVRMALGACIEPAASAALPQLVPAEAVGAANAAIGSTYGVVFAVGVGAGGVVTAYSGPVGALAIDAATFVIAAAIFSRLPRLQPERVEGRAGEGVGAAWRLAWREPALLQAVFAKLPLAIANGGGWVYLHAVAGGRGGDAALALGLLHGARALGMGLGPVLWARAPALASTAAGMHVGTWLSFVAIALFIAGPPEVGLVAALVWGTGLGANWVTATTRVQSRTPNGALGRMAAIDLLGHTVGGCVGGVAGALAADHAGDMALAGWLGLGVGVATWAAVQGLVAARRSGGR
jgi:hypothetical protein